MDCESSETRATEVHNKPPYHNMVHNMSTHDYAETETSANLSHRETTTGNVEAVSTKSDTNADIVSCCNRSY